MRRSGLLHHITSLPAPYGIGDMGPSAYRFADFLSNTGQTIWQLLPLNPTNPLYGHSPYLSTSSCAYNPLLVSIEMLVEDGLLQKDEVVSPQVFSGDSIDFSQVALHRERLFRRAFDRFRKIEKKSKYNEFCINSKAWLDDYALFVVIRNSLNGVIWNSWPKELRDRDPVTLKEAARVHKEEVELVKFLQFVCFSQWSALKKYCNEKGILLFGDIPIYVDFDSADVWSLPDIFNLDEKKNLAVVAGVPPDYFSATGQLWGNPLYRWDILRDRNYDWWIRRIGHNGQLFDMVRIDHFRGLVAYWEVPAGESTAVKGRWVDAPAYDFLQRVREAAPDLYFVAEDLGIITPDVTEVMEHFGFPGMKVLQFAFGSETATNPYLPHNISRNCIMYTGTHDNNTTRGWFENDAAAGEKNALCSYTGKNISEESVSWDMIRLGMASVADTCIVPTQDVLGLGAEGRMNVPSTPTGNWQWRLKEGDLTEEHASRLRDMTRIYGRCKQ